MPHGAAVFAAARRTTRTTACATRCPAGGAFYLDVQCQRAGYDGPITLGIDSPRSGWQIFNNMIAAKANEVKMYVVPPLDLAPGELAELRIVGRGPQRASSIITSEMATTVPLRTARPQMPYPPALARRRRSSFRRPSRKPSFFKLSADASEVELPPRAAKPRSRSTSSGPIPSSRTCR